MRLSHQGYFLLLFKGKHLKKMDQIHVRSDIAYKGRKLYAPNLNTQDPTKNVFAISVHKK